MPSSSIIAHRMRGSRLSNSSSFGELAPSVSSIIDGLSPHPSVHAEPFMPSTPPPLIQGLERHPDAPKPFASSFLDHGRSSSPSGSDEYGERRLEFEDDLEGGYYGASRMSESRLDSKSLYSSRFSRGSSFVSQRLFPYTESSMSNDIDGLPGLPSALPFDDRSPTNSVLSTSTGSSSSSSSSLSEISALELSELNGERSASPFDDPIDTSPSTNGQLQLHVSIQDGLETKSTAPSHLLVSLADDDDEVAPSPHSQTCSRMLSNPFSDFVHGFEPRSSFFKLTGAVNNGVTGLKARSPTTNTSPGAISRLLMDYFRGLE